MFEVKTSFRLEVSFRFVWFRNDVWVLRGIYRVFHLPNVEHYNLLENFFPRLKDKLHQFWHFVDKKLGRVDSFRIYCLKFAEAKNEWFMFFFVCIYNGRVNADLFNYSNDLHQLYRMQKSTLQPNYLQTSCRAGWCVRLICVYISVKNTYIQHTQSSE